MRIYYEDREITEFVLPEACVYRDASHGKADTLEITFRRAASWHQWDPQMEDRIRILHGGCDTGEMFVDTIVPEGDRYRMIATSLPRSARRKAWECFRNVSLKTVMHRYAAECMMNESVWGADENTQYPFLMRENEGGAAFLNRLCEMEGLALKAWNRKWMAIDIITAQTLDTQSAIEIRPEQDGCRYIHQPGMKYSSLTIKSPWAEATARDANAAGGAPLTVGGLPAMDAAQAGRWARGLLLHHNRRADSLTVDSRINPGMTALVRVRVTGATCADGYWLVDEAEHDFVNDTTRTKMLRIVQTIR